MRYKLADDAKPQLKMLFVATLITLGLWFTPYAEYLVYPIRLFVTFAHESSHALVALVTGGSVQSLSISADGSGVVYSASSSLFGTLLTSTAGYLGTVVLGVLLLYFLRKNFSSQKILVVLGCLTGLITILFGIISPLFHLFSLQVPFASLAFTIFSGGLISLALVGTGMYAGDRVANFIVGFLAVQCLMNAISDLKTVLIVNTPVIGSNIQTDAANMAAATGIPGILWVAVWIAASIGFLLLGIRMYAAVKAAKPTESVFAESGPA